MPSFAIGCIAAVSVVGLGVGAYILYRYFPPLTKKKKKKKRVALAPSAPVPETGETDLYDDTVTHPTDIRDEGRRGAHAMSVEQQPLVVCANSAGPPESVAAPLSLADDSSCDYEVSSEDSDELVMDKVASKMVQETSSRADNFTIVDKTLQNGFIPASTSSSSRKELNTETNRGRINSIDTTDSLFNAIMQDLNSSCSFSSSSGDSDASAAV